MFSQSISTVNGGDSIYDVPETGFNNTLDNFQIADILPSLPEFSAATPKSPFVNRPGTQVHSFRKKNFLPWGQLPLQKLNSPKTIVDENELKLQQKEEYIQKLVKNNLKLTSLVKKKNQMLKSY